MSQEDLAWETRKHGPGVSYNAIRKYERGTRVGSRASGPRERSAEMQATYRQLAAALGIEAHDFHEYRLLLMRDALDESIVGLEVALSTLALIEGSTPEGVVPPPPADSPLRPSATPPKRQGRAKSKTPRGDGRRGRA